MDSEHIPPADRRLTPAAPLRRQDFAHADPKLAYEDPLTGLHNRRLLDHLLDQRWPDLLGVHDELALVVLDLDRFKGINDRYGHLIGDQVLTVAARVLRESFREEDFLIRYGGDEFVHVASSGRHRRPRFQGAPKRPASRCLAASVSRRIPMMGGRARTCCVRRISVFMTRSGSGTQRLPRSRNVAPSA